MKFGTWNAGSMNNSGSLRTSSIGINSI